MKRVAGLRAAGLPLAQGVRVFAGMEPPPLTREERAEMRALRADAVLAAREAAEEREAVQAVEREQAEAREAARLAEWRREAGPPKPPQNPTGWYLCENLDRAFFRVGEGPWPDYRPPGLYWRREWTWLDKPADVPWEDERPVWAPDPKPTREAVGKAVQGSLF